MRILVVGKGGREHALAWRLSQEAEVIVAPGNPGISADCETVNVSSKDHGALLALCKSREIDLVVVGPEDPLIDGLGDAMRAAGVPVYGPNADGARLEGSKAFSKELMSAAGVPTAPFQQFTHATRATEYARRRFGEGRCVVVKASGNALGKGVVVASEIGEAEQAIERMMVDKVFGSAGDTIVIEDRLDGPEFSLLTIVGEKNFVSLPVAQDYKRAFDGDIGPNTGGMGAYSPVDWITDDLVREVERTFVQRTLDALRQRGIDYRGTLFSGIMVDSGQPYCLEFNVRMGDPETQSLMMRVNGGYAEALMASAKGSVISAPSVSPDASLTVVVAAQDYPSSGSKGAPISLSDLPPNSKLFHAGTTLHEGQLVTDGGRVMCASASASTLSEARGLAYLAAASVSFEGSRFRDDIGL